MGLKFATNNIIVDVLLDFIFQKGVKKVFNILFTRVTSLYKKWGVVAVQISWFRQSIAQAESFRSQNCIEGVDRNRSKGVWEEQIYLYYANVVRKETM